MGIDPGYAIVGYGVLDCKGHDLAPVAFGAVTTEAHTEFEDRLLEVYDDVRRLLDSYRPTCLAVETLFFSRNATTAVAVAEARGVILLAARQSNVPVFEYSPMQVKQGVAGYGKATKPQVQEMTRQLLRLKAIPKPDDAADALAVAVCHAHSAGSRQFGLTETKRRRMGYY